QDSSSLTHPSGQPEGFNTIPAQLICSVAGEKLVGILLDSVQDQVTANKDDQTERASAQRAKPVRAAGEKRPQRPLLTAVAAKLSKEVLYAIENKDGSAPAGELRQCFFGSVPRGIKPGRESKAGQPHLAPCDVI